MKITLRLLVIVILTWLMVSCSTAAATPEFTLATTSIPPTATHPPPATAVPKPSATPLPPKPTEMSKFTIQKSINQGAKGTPTPNPYLLSEAGPFQVGKRSFTAIDPSRPDRPISITLWYPALGSVEGLSATMDAEPDPSGAPYPLILSSTKLANIFAAYLVSHGFSWASIDKIDTYDETNPEMVHQPRDILFALEQVASNPPPDLVGIFDTDHAGATGYSFDGYNALALSGARLDPEYYLALCADPNKTEQTVDFNFYEKYHCGAARGWDSFTAAAGEAITVSQDGLWQPMTDPRLKAVLPMGADGWFLFGERGLADVKMPVMLLAGTLDSAYQENGLILENLGTPDKFMISVLRRTHGIIYEPDMLPVMRHFITAFFGYYLAGREEYATYFSEDFVKQQGKLGWGMVEGK